MPQIGFTKKQSPVFHRFNALRRTYEDANGGGRVYNPDFLSVLMDAWEEKIKHPFVSKILGEVKDRHNSNVSLRADIADAEANDQELQPVRIKDSDNRYVYNASVAASNIFLTKDQSGAMVFGTRDEAEAFLRKWGRVADGWIFEPVN